MAAPDTDNLHENLDHDGGEEGEGIISNTTTSVSSGGDTAAAGGSSLINALDSLYSSLTTTTKIVTSSSSEINQRQEEGPAVVSPSTTTTASTSTPSPTPTAETASERTHQPQAGAVEGRVLSRLDSGSGDDSSGHSLGQLVDWSMDFYEDEEEALVDAMMMADEREANRSAGATDGNVSETIEFRRLDSIEEEEEANNLREDDDSDESSSSLFFDSKSNSQPSATGEDREEEEFNEEDYVVNRLGIEVDQMEGKLNSLFDNWKGYKKDEIVDFQKKRRSFTLHDKNDGDKKQKQGKQPTEESIVRNNMQQHVTASTVPSNASTLAKGSMVLDQKPGDGAANTNAVQHTWVDLDELSIPDDVNVRQQHLLYQSVHVDLDDIIFDVDDQSQSGNSRHCLLDDEKKGNNVMPSSQQQSQSTSTNNDEVSFLRKRRIIGDDQSSLPNHFSMFFQKAKELMMRLHCSCQEDYDGCEQLPTATTSSNAYTASPPTAIAVSPPPPPPPPAPVRDDGLYEI